MVAGVCSGAVIRKGGVHHLKPDTVCDGESQRESACVCVTEKEREMCDRDRGRERERD